MAIIRDTTIDWTILKRDKYLRNQEAPALFDDPITVRDIRSGSEVISRSGNVMPRAITRDKLGEDALLAAMNINITSTYTIQVATGYDRALNNYIYAVTWDGMNYYLRRFNTLDLLSPYQDGYSVNLPVDSERDDILALTVLGTKIGVLYHSKNSSVIQTKILFYDFDLNYLSTISAPKSFASALGDLAFRRNLVFDGNYFVHSFSPNARVEVRQNYQDASASIAQGGATPYAVQKFTTVSDGNIKKIGLLLGNNGNATQIDIRLFQGGTFIGNVALGYGIGAYASLSWHYFNVNFAVSDNTQYQIVVHDVVTGTAAEWGFKNGGNVYNGGYFAWPTASADPADPADGRDAAFQIFQEMPSTVKNKIARYNTSDYSLVDSFSWPGGTVQPDELMAYDKKFFYGLNVTDKKIVKFAIQDNLVAVASEQVIQETLRGMMNFNSYIYLVYIIGSSLVAVPVSV